MSIVDSVKKALGMDDTPDVHQTDDERALVSRVEDAIRASYTAKQQAGWITRAIERDKFMRGEHWTSKREDRPYPVYRLCEAVVGTLEPFLCEGEISATLTIKGQDDDELEEALTQIAVGVMEEGKLSDLRRETEPERLVQDHCYIQVEFDANAYKPPQGKVVFSMLPGANAFPDPDAGFDIQAGEFFGMEFWRSLRYIKRNYPERGKHVKAEARESARTDVFAREKGQPDPSGHANLTVMYFKDPKGLRKVVVANGILLFDSYKEMTKKREMYPAAFEGRDPDDLSWYRHGLFPVEYLADRRVPKSVYATSTVDMVIPVNKEINRVKQAILENLVIAGYGTTVFNPKLTGLTREMLERIQAKAGQVLPVNDMNGIRRDAIPYVPESHFKYLETLKQEAQFLAGMLDVLRGAMPASGTPAQAIERLYQSASAVAMLKRADSQRAYAAALVQGVWLALEHYTEERMFPSVRKDAGTKQVAIRPADILAQLKELPMMDVSVQMGVGSPVNREYMRERINNLWQMVDPATRQPIIDADMVLEANRDIPGMEELIQRRKLEMEGQANADVDQFLASLPDAQRMALAGRPVTEIRAMMQGQMGGSAQMQGQPMMNEQPQVAAMGGQ